MKASECKWKVIGLMRTISLKFYLFLHKGKVNYKALMLSSQNHFSRLQWSENVGLQVKEKGHLPLGYWFHLDVRHRIIMVKIRGRQLKWKRNWSKPKCPFKNNYFVENCAQLKYAQNFKESCCIIIIIFVTLKFEPNTDNLYQPCPCQRVLFFIIAT